MTVPAVLIGLRILLGPIIIASAWHGLRNQWLMTMVIAGVLTDYFDGVVARRLGIASETLRRFDSQADVFFWVCAVAAAYFTHRASFVHALPGILLLAALELVCYAISFWRFAREPSSHSILAKLYGIALCIGTVSILCFGGTRLFKFAVMTGVAANLDIILILLLLRNWDHDVRSSYHAWLLRRGSP